MKKSVLNDTKHKFHSKKYKFQLIGNKINQFETTLSLMLTRAAIIDNALAKLV